MGLIINVVFYCQFHQLKTTKNHISNKPRLKASKFLKEILKDFSLKTEEEFKTEMKFFLEIFKEKIKVSK